jgi:hypothetical protein
MLTAAQATTLRLIVYTLAKIQQRLLNAAFLAGLLIQIIGLEGRGASSRSASTSLTVLLSKLLSISKISPDILAGRMLEILNSRHEKVPSICAGD